MFDSEFSLDRFNLEVEAERQAELMRKYTKLYVKFKSLARDEARKLDILEAELAIEYRKNKKEYGITKDTDQVIFKIIKGDPKYEEQWNQWHKLQSLADNYKFAIDTISEKGWMIKELVKLWLNNYYANPVVKKSEIETIKPKRINLIYEED